jgi:hypothetical protein
MDIAVGLLNVVLGIAYTSYGVITIIDLKRGWKTMGFSHFGAAWVFMAFTCGPHHLVHGTHLLFEGRSGGALDLAAVLVGLPAGIAFWLLRVEATVGGRGDRFITGTPLWVHSIPTVSAMYLTALTAAVLVNGQSLSIPRQVAPNLILVAVYFMIGYQVGRTQLRNRPVLGGWSVSGLSLAVIFPTCGLMHGIYAMYAASNRYHLDWHGWVIDWLAVPSAIYFLWVVRGLYRQAFPDWNRAMVDAAPDVVAA